MNSSDVECGHCNRNNKIIFSSKPHIGFEGWFTCLYCGKISYYMYTGQRFASIAAEWAEIGEEEGGVQYFE